MNMYSNNQWSFNPAAYHNVPYEQVDWASLAQQWIKMKETLPNTNQGPAPPPAPQISKPAATEPTPTPTPKVTQSDIEGGEAPMDMDTKDDDGPNVGVAPSGNWNEWGNWQSQWGWGWSANAGTVPLAESTQSATASVDSKVKSQSNDSIPVLNDVRNFPIIGNTGTCTPQVPSSFNYNNSGGGMIPPIHPKTNYNFDSSFTPVPAKSADSWSKSKNANKQTSQKPIPTEQFAVMDATKKKQLPAWIREGLNKMEREKQRKLEQERMMQEKMRMEQMRPEMKEPEPNPLPIYAEIPPQQDRPATPDYAHRSPEIVPKPRRRSPAAETSRQRSRLDAPVLRKTKDQIMEESMLKVRRILTELLLEATEKQVHLIAKEEHRRFRVSASAQPIRKSNALTSLTGNLGLDVYDSDDNSSDGERDNDNNDADSDEELQMLIEKKKRDFTLVEDEIERLIEDQEMKERLIAQQDAKDEDDNDDDGNEDDEEDELRNRKIPDRDTSTPHQRNIEHDKDRPATNDRADSKPSEDYYRSRRREDAGNETKQLNGDTKSQEADKTTRQSKKKSKSRSSSSSSSTSTSSSSSNGTSTSESTSSKSDRSTGSSSESRRKSKKSKSRKRNDKKSEREVKKRRDSSESNSEKRSSSRSRYHDRYKRSKHSDSVERKRRRRSPSYHRRSPSYHKSSRREQSSKYKDSPSSSSHTRRRDYSRESKRSRYRSSSRESRYKRR